MRPIDKLATTFAELGVPYLRTTFSGRDSLAVTIFVSRPVGDDEDTFEEEVHFTFEKDSGKFSGHYHTTT